MSSRPSLYGLLAEFEDPEELAAAIRQARDRGYRQMDAYTPFPVEDVTEALDFRPSRIRWLILAGAIIGGLVGYGVQYWTNVILYPYNAGGRPLHSWPAFIPITFEMIILVAALVGAAAVIVLNRLPQLYHPVFNVPEFSRALEDRFFLCIEAKDEYFDPATTRRFLEDLRPSGVWDVPR